MDAQRIKDILGQMAGLVHELQQMVTSADPVQAHIAPVLSQLDDQALNDFDSLKKALTSDRWPEAVNPNLICDPNSDEDKTDRGRGIVELMIEEDLKGLRFLDFGCGEGHCASVAADRHPIVSVGYDVKRHERWARFLAADNLLFTTEFETVTANGPYDVIVLFDVLDHVVGETPSNLLARIRSLLADNGKVYMRTHPFSSRHGTHSYHSLNKAYVHLVFSEAELESLVPDKKYIEPSIRVIYPIKTYDDLIDKAGLKVDNRRDITEKVEAFFKIPKIAERIMKNAGTDFFPEYQMSLQFLDYKISKK